MRWFLFALCLCGCGQSKMGDWHRAEFVYVGSCEEQNLHVMLDGSHMRDWKISHVQVSFATPEESDEPELLVPQQIESDGRGGLKVKFSPPVPGEYVLHVRLTSSLPWKAADEDLKTLAVRVYQ